MTKITSAKGLGLLLLLSGCVGAADCDPNAVGNVFTSAACSSGGQFGVRQQTIAGNLGTLQQEIENERIAVSQANSRIRELRRNQQISADQAQRLNGEIAALQREIDALGRVGGDPAQANAQRVRIAQRQAAINQTAGVTVF